MKEKLSNLRDYIWDKLFLDFYLDKRWTLEFKLMNLISRDVLRSCLTEVRHYLGEIDLDKLDDPLVKRRFKHAKYWTDAAWCWWSKEE